MTDNIPKICAAFEIWQDNDCIKAGTTLELIMRYLADDPEIDVVVSSADQDRAYRDYIGRQNENLNAKTLIIRDLNKNRTDVLSVSRTMIDNLEAELKTAKSDYEIMRTNCGNTIAKLRDDIEGLEAGLSARKEDSEVLMKVVEAVRQYDGSHEHGTMNTFNHVFNLLVDYLDAPEGPPEVKTTMFEVEYLVDGSRTIHLQKMRIAEQKQTIEKLKADSAVLKKVVDAIRYWESSSTHSLATVTEIKDIIDDYLNTPEASPEIPIDDLYRVSVFLEMP